MFAWHFVRWAQPMVLAVALSLVMLGLGGFGGLINMSYAMSLSCHLKPCAGFAVPQVEIFGPGADAIPD